MKSICVFAASNSKQSINQQLATYAASFLEDVSIDLIDLNDYEMPIYSPEREANGIPQLAMDFDTRLRKADGLIISFAEHNGSFSAAFKNILDWTSRLKGDKGWAGKPLLAMATSPGGRGGIRVLDAAQVSLPHMGFEMVSTFSLPSFSKNFQAGVITEPELKAKLEDAVANFQKAL